MRQPKRYAPFAMFANEVAYYDMRKVEEGHYVEYTSYAKLEAELNAEHKKLVEARWEIVRLTKELAKAKVAR